MNRSYFSAPALALAVAALIASGAHAQTQGTKGNDSGAAHGANHGTSHGSGHGSATGSSQGSAHGTPAASPAAAATQAPEFVPAEVRRVDTEAQKLTLRHGPIPNLGMSDMTMVFHAADPTLLTGLKAGDKIRFKADRVDGEYRVIAVEPAR